MLPFFSIGQILNHAITADIGSNREGVTLLFYDSFEKEFEDSQFSRFCLVRETDTFCIDNGDIWVEQKELYAHADKQFDNRVGLLEENNKLYFWLTGFQYGCCYNNTTILEWTGKSLNQLFSMNFEVRSIEIINNKRYIIGNYSLAEGYGNEQSDYHFFSFFPTEYRILSDQMSVDSALTQQMNLKYKTIENDLNVYSAVIVHLNHFDENLLISKKLQSSIMDRDYGIISLKRLDRTYFAKYTKQDLRIIRNELFAFNGYKFNSKDLFEYFKKKKWYKPTKITAEEISTRLTEIEKHNINLIREIEKSGW